MVQVVYLLLLLLLLITMAYVQAHNHGVTISRPEKQQQISLTLGEWSRLGVYAERINGFMSRNSHEGEKWYPLGDPDRSGGAELRATLSYYEGSPFCSIRVYVSGNPTKQGVTLSEGQWTSVHASLGHGPEVTIAREVYEKILRNLVLDGRQKLCEGCREGWCSQNDHECLTMSGGRALTQRVLASGPGVDLFEFQRQVCTIAFERQVPMKTSLTALYDLCNMHFRSEMEECFLADEMPPPPAAIEVVV